MNRWRSQQRCYSIDDVDRLFAALDTALVAALPRSGDVLVRDSAAGMILKSPDGNYWRASISNAGVLAWTPIGTTPPT